MKKNYTVDDKTGIIKFHRAGFAEFENGKVVSFTPTEGIKNACASCKDTGKIWVDYGPCGHEDCPPEAHRGFEDCEDCNVRSIRREA
jgi:hypothetical protein